MRVYVEYDEGFFDYQTAVVPRNGEKIIYEDDIASKMYFLKVLDVAYYTNKDYNEIHIKAELEHQKSVL